MLYETSIKLTSKSICEKIESFAINYLQIGYRNDIEDSPRAFTIVDF